MIARINGLKKLRPTCQLQKVHTRDDSGNSTQLPVANTKVPFAARTVRYYRTEQRNDAPGLLSTHTTAGAAGRLITAIPEGRQDRTQSLGSPHRQPTIACGRCSRRGELVSANADQRHGRDRLQRGDDQQNLARAPRNVLGRSGRWALQSRSFAAQTAQGKADPFATHKRDAKNTTANCHRRRIDASLVCLPVRDLSSASTVPCRKTVANGFSVVLDLRGSNHRFLTQSPVGTYPVLRSTPAIHRAEDKQATGAAIDGYCDRSPEVDQRALRKSVPGLQYPGLLSGERTTVETRVPGHLERRNLQECESRRTNHTEELPRKGSNKIQCHASRTGIVDSRTLYGRSFRTKLRSANRSNSRTDLLGTCAGVLSVALDKLKASCGGLSPIHAATGSNWTDVWLLPLFFYHCKHRSSSARAVVVCGGSLSGPSDCPPLQTFSNRFVSESLSTHGRLNP